MDISRVAVDRMHAEQVKLAALATHTFMMITNMALKPFILPATRP